VDLQDQMTVQQQELEALKNRLRHTHESHMIETSKMQAHLQQLEKSGDAATLQKLKQVGTDNLLSSYSSLALLSW
jgi:hypothetical protein